MRAIANAVSGRKGMLLICGDHETHLKVGKLSKLHMEKHPHRCL